MRTQTTKEHILLSAIGAIEKFGLPNLTTRMIAEHAGVNNAALHYYFGTKENLIDAAMKQTKEHMLEDIEVILSGDSPIKDRVSEMLTYIIEGSIRYPNIIRAHMIGPLLNSQRQAELADLLNTWVTVSAEAIQPYVSRKSASDLKLILNMLFSVIWTFGLFAEDYENYGWINLKDSEERKNFLDNAIIQLFNP
jgi:AcrR family transcriptional regulator